MCKVTVPFMCIVKNSTHSKLARKPRIYATLKLRPTYLLTRVKPRATSVSKNYTKVLMLATNLRYGIYEIWWVRSRGGDPGLRRVWLQKQKVAQAAHPSSTSWHASCHPAGRDDVTLWSLSFGINETNSQFDKVQGVFLHWAFPEKLEYEKPRLGESTLT